MNYRVHYGIFLHKNGTHSLTFFHIFPHKSKIIGCNRLHHHFFYKNSLPYVSFCKAGSLQHDSFFSTYVFCNLASVNTSYRTRKVVFTRCILSFSEIFCNYNLLLCPKNRKGGIFLYGIHLGMDEDSKVLFSFSIFIHKNAGLDHNHLQD